MYVFWNLEALTETKEIEEEPSPIRRPRYCLPLSLWFPTVVFTHILAHDHFQRLKTNILVLNFYH